MKLSQNLEKNNETDYIDRLIQSGNLMDLSNNLSDLLQLIRYSGAKPKILNQLLSSVRQYNYVNILENRLNFPKSKHYIFDEDKSAAMYLNLRWQKCPNIKDNLLALESIIDIINNEITFPQGPIISNSSINGIVKYLNRIYGYSEKVLKYKPLTILRFQNSDKRWNACCTTVITENDKIETIISVYHRHADSNASPEYIFFHELGHVLQIAVTGSCKEVPESFLHIASPIFPGLDTEYLDQAPEFFADCFAMGAMLCSPFSTLCPFANIQYNDKNLFRFYMKALISSLK